jgi:hypothetical protein
MVLLLLSADGVAPDGLDKSLLAICGGALNGESSCKAVIELGGGGVPRGGGDSNRPSFPLLMILDGEDGPAVPSEPVDEASLAAEGEGGRDEDDTWTRGSAERFSCTLREAN